MSLVKNILQGVGPLVHQLTDGHSIVLRSESGATPDPETLDVSTGPGTEMSVPCSVWANTARGYEVADGRLRVAIDGQLEALVEKPRAGMLALVDGRSYTVAEATHDLDMDDWILVLEGAG